MNLTDPPAIPTTYTQPGPVSDPLYNVQLTVLSAYFP